MARDYEAEIEADIERAGTEVLEDPEAVRRIDDALLRMNRGDIDEVEFRRIWNEEVLAKIEHRNEMRSEERRNNEGDWRFQMDQEERAS
jgi:hypothetical protein